jgi:hypothetical protein
MGDLRIDTGNEHQIGDAAFMAKVKGAIMATAEQRFTSIEQRACRYGDNIWMPMLVGQGTTPRVFELMMGHFLSKDFSPSKTNSYMAGLFTTADYFLGCNPLNMAYVTHLGVRYPERVMHLDSWYSKTGEIIPGITPYGPWKDDGATPATGPWDIHWPYKTLYPDGINNWPGHERWFNNYTTPMNAEFTVHQNTILSAVVYGYLCDVPDGSFDPNDKPSVGIVYPSPNAEIGGDIIIDVLATDPDGENDIAWVEFYNDWHKIGQSNIAPYSFTWKKPAYGTAKLTAKVIDKSGFSNKSETVQITTIPPEYRVSVVVTDSITNFPVSTCEVKIQDSTKITTAEGLATFEKVTGLMNILLQKKGYKSKNLNQISIYSDTTLYFTLTPIKKSITIVLRDDYSGSFITSAFVNFNSVSKTTGVNGDVTFSEYDGTYAYSLTKTNYFTGEGELKIASDTILNLLMTRSQAEIKFVLQQGAVPVSNAKVAVLTDTATTSNLGIARIRNLNVPSNFEYHIYKSGFRDVMGSVYLRTDTTLNIQMEMIPVNVGGFEKTENLRIWPNPVDEILFLSSSESIAGYSVYNLAGSKIKVESSAVNGIIQLDFSSVIAGIYFIEISFVNHRNVTRKIIRK